MGEIDFDYVDNLYLDEFSKVFPKLHYSLICLLNQDESWKIVVQTAEQKFQIFFSDHVWYELSRSTNPARIVYNELKQRMFNVSNFKDLVKNSNLLNILSIISKTEPLKILVQPGGGDVNNICKIDDGGVLELKCIGEGLPPPTYQWYHGNLEINGATEPILKINSFGPDQCGEYICVLKQNVNDEIWSIESDCVYAELAPIPPTILVDLPETYILNKGCCCKLQVKCKARPDPTFTWYRDGQRLENYKNSDSLIFDKVSSISYGEYYCKIENSAGKILSGKCLLQVIASPEKNFPIDPPSIKVALLIGNEDYKYQTKLKYAANDIALIAKNMKALNFHVIALLNLSSQELKNAITWVFKNIPPNAYVFFYYTGHGFTSSRYRYMMPVDVELSDLNEFVKKCFIVKQLTKDFHSAKGKLLIAVFDMCLKLIKGLESIDEPVIEIKYHSGETLMMFATSDDLKAYEINPDNGLYSLYARCVANNLILDVGVNQIATNVQNEVKRSIKDIKLQLNRGPVPKSENNIYSELSLKTDSVNNDVAKAKMDKWNELKESHQLNFHIVNLSMRVHTSFYKDCYQNVIVLTFPKDIGWEIDVTFMHPKITRKRNYDEDGRRIITVFNVQKALSGISVTVQLFDKRYYIENNPPEPPIDQYTFDFGDVTVKFIAMLN